MSDDDPAVFDAGEAFLLRAPVLPRGTAGDDGRSGLVAAARRDPVVAEALLVSSPSLYAALEEPRAGRRPSPARTRRLSRSMLRYHLRMTRRATPFGLLAGVALGTFGGAPRARLTGRRTRHIQPDQAWLGALLDARDAGAPPDDVRVVLDNTARTRGDQLVLPMGLRSGRPVRRALRRTPPIDTVLRAARRPVRLGDLAEAVLEDCPGLTREKAVGLLTRLIALEFLLTDSAPQPVDPDPFEHLARTAPELPVLREYTTRARAYAAQAVGEGTSALSALHDAAGSPECLHVDMALDADIRLPPEVAAEAARAASVLWRCAPPQTAEQRALAAYHREFLETYGQGERVPVTALLTPGSGLGPPAGYALPGGSRPLPDPPADAARTAALNALYAGALVSGDTGVELDEETLRALDTGRGRPPASADFPVSLLADSLADVAADRFVLEVAPFRVCRPAGTLWGRFSHVLGAQEHLAEFARRARAAEGAGPRPVRVDYAPRERRMLNVTRVPDPPGRPGARLAVGTYGDPGAPGDVDLAEVLVHADTRRFHLLDASDGRPISPCVPHALNNALAPDVARFLLEVPLMGVTQVTPWDWGHLATAPFLPAVRHGRSILSPATWRIPAAVLTKDDPGRHLAHRRARWRIPDRVHLVRADLRLALDLRLPEHRELLYEEAHAQGEAVLHEDLSAAGPGWLRGPGGAHDAELVIPLFARPAPRPHRPRADAVAEPASRPVGPAGSAGAVDASTPGTPGMPGTNPPATVGMTAGETAGARAHGPTAHLPGGEWLSVHIPSAPEDQSRILTAYVEPWLRTVSGDVDRWFFVRYREPGTHTPHLRLRLHGTPSVLARQVLPSLHDWMRGLMAQGLARTWSLREYRPETDRYGGPAAIGLAERFFHEDSRLALSRLPSDSDPLPVAADLVRLVRGFQTERGQDWERWLLDQYAKDPRRHRTFSRRRRDALALIPDGGPDTPAGLDDWYASLTAYSAAVRAGDADVSRVLRALLHMHANRVLRFGTDLEQDAYALARGAVGAHHDRRRASLRARAQSGAGGPTRKE
ncbi:lantibiotic dehydratase [Streptomyces sp. AK02-01A]|uniref:lantibiotic dehydratase n=1 Tax=Streptomyces sp. AK02-01A TaxID=3028648 RepID=UPI0029A7C533|nr:lantibiotic dehydratase [Streptomyces sp. AK02-01A]MDX3851733.1 lantibiotic dehydratase [Streptomyces sp. AK02-01A]